MLVDETTTLAVQVNGKMRGTIDVPVNADEAAVREIALALENVQGFIAGKEIRKVIVVPNRIVNVVV